MESNYFKSIEAHRKLNIEWMVQNGFIAIDRANGTKGEMEELSINNLIGNSSTVIGEYAGFMRCVNSFGNIYEGTFEGGKMNGFCISYIGNR